MINFIKSLQNHNDTKKNALENLNNITHHALYFKLVNKKI